MNPNKLAGLVGILVFIGIAVYLHQREQDPERIAARARTIQQAAPAAGVQVDAVLDAELVHTPSEAQAIIGWTGETESYVRQVGLHEQVLADIQDICRAMAPSPTQLPEAFCQRCDRSFYRSFRYVAGDEQRFDSNNNAPVIKILHYYRPCFARIHFNIVVSGTVVQVQFVQNNAMFGGQYVLRYTYYLINGIWCMKEWQGGFDWSKVVRTDQVPYGFDTRNLWNNTFYARLDNVLILVANRYLWMRNYNSVSRDFPGVAGFAPYRNYFEGN